jgi:hypothetical protein
MLMGKRVELFGIVVGVTSLCFSEFGLFEWTVDTHRSLSSLWTHSPSSGMTCCRENWSNIIYGWVESLSSIVSCVKHF